MLHQIFIFCHKAMKHSQTLITNSDYFSAIPKKTKAKIKFSNKSFDEFLQHANGNYFFLKPITSDEII